MDESEVYRGLTEIFHMAFLRDDLVLRPELTARHVDGWTSFKMIEIVMAVEEHYNIKLSIPEVDRLKNVGDLAALIVKKTTA